MSRTTTNESEQSQGLLTFEQAATWLGVKESWLRRAVTAKQVPHRRLGRVVRFAVDDLLAIVSDSAVTPESTRTEIKPRRRRSA